MIKAGLEYLSFTTQAEAATWQNILHNAHVGGLKHSRYTDYKNGTSKFDEPFKPNGEAFWILATPDMVQMSVPLRNVLNLKVRSISTEVSKLSWNYESEDI